MHYVQFQYGTMLKVALIRNGIQSTTCKYMYVTIIIHFHEIASSRKIEKNGKKRFNE